MFTALIRSTREGNGEGHPRPGQRYTSLPLPLGRTGVPIPPLPCPPPCQHARTVVQRGWYASFVHAEGLSCYLLKLQVLQIMLFPISTIKTLHLLLLYLLVFGPVPSKFCQFYLRTFACLFASLSRYHGCVLIFKNNYPESWTLMYFRCSFPGTAFHIKCLDNLSRQLHFVCSADLPDSDGTYVVRLQQALGNLDIFGLTLRRRTLIRSVKILSTEPMGELARLFH